MRVASSTDMEFSNRSSTSCFFIKIYNLSNFSAFSCEYVESKVLYKDCLQSSPLITPDSLKFLSVIGLLFRETTLLTPFLSEMFLSNTIRKIVLSTVLCNVATPSPLLKLPSPPTLSNPSTKVGLFTIISDTNLYKPP